MKHSPADIQQAERQVAEAVAQVDSQVENIIRLRWTKQSTAEAEAALDKMVVLRDDAVERLKVMRQGSS